MARDHGRILTAIWSDPDFRELTRGAQHLYLMLVSDPSLNYAGVADWRPARILPRTTGWTMPELQAAADELIDRLYILLDADTEEALVRSFVRSDGLMRQRHMGVSMARAHAAVASNELRGVIVHELIRLHDDDPTIKGWESSEVTRILVQPSLDPGTYPLGRPPVQPPIQPPVQGELHPPIQGSIQPPIQGEPGVASQPPIQPPSTPSPSPSPTPTPKEGGYVPAIGNEGASENPDDTTPHCPDHPGGTDQPCRPCGAHRARHAQEHAERERQLAEQRSATTRQNAADRRADIDACDLCDTDGYNRLQVCDHDPHRADRNARGIAEVRAALGA